MFGKNIARASNVLGAAGGMRGIQYSGRNDDRSNRWGEWVSERGILRAKNSVWQRKKQKHSIMARAINISSGGINGV